MIGTNETVVVELNADVLEAIAAAAALNGGGAVQVVFEVMPEERPASDGTYAATVKVKAGGRWTPPLARAGVRSERLYEEG